MEIKIETHNYIFKEKSIKNIFNDQNEILRIKFSRNKKLLDKKKLNENGDINLTKLNGKLILPKINTSNNNIISNNLNYTNEKEQNLIIPIIKNNIIINLNKGQVLERESPVKMERQLKIRRNKKEINITKEEEELKKMLDKKEEKKKLREEWERNIRRRQLSEKKRAEEEEIKLLEELNRKKERQELERQKRKKLRKRLDLAIKLKEEKRKEELKRICLSEKKRKLEIKQSIEMQK